MATRGKSLRNPRDECPISTADRGIREKLLTAIADCYIKIADRYMRMGAKVRYLREVEGTLRGLGRSMTQPELVRAIREERGRSISQAYLSQIESGARPHLTASTRALLAGFFKVHPGYLVDDPEGYHTELLSEARTLEDSLDAWLLDGAERFRKDPEVAESLKAISAYPDSRRALVLLREVLAAPGLADRLMDVFKTERSAR